MNDAPLMREFERRGDVACQPQDILLGEGTLPGDAGAEAVGAQIHGEVDVLPRFRDRANADDVGVLELRGRLALVAKPALELGIAGIAGLQDLDGHGGPVLLAPDERPGEPPLAEEALQGVGAKGLTDEVGRGVNRGHFTKGCEPVNLRRFQRLGNRDDVR